MPSWGMTSLCANVSRGTESEKGSNRIAFDDLCLIHSLMQKK